MEQHKINILQLVDGFGMGGAETKLLELIEHLDKDKYNLSICSLNFGGDLKKEFNKLGVKVFEFGRKHRFDFSLIPRLLKLYKEENIDIVMTTLFYADVVGAISAKLGRVPATISWETISHENEFYYPWHRKMAYRFGMKFVKKIVSVSDDVRQSINKVQGVEFDKIQTIHYGVNTKKYQKKNEDALKKELELSDHFPIIGVVARLVEVKGHEYLIKALPAVVKKHPKLKLVLIGDGNSRPGLEKLVKEFGLMENVDFLGLRKDIFNLLNVLDLFVLPSISEGLPNSILESMACSVPVVASAVGGIPEAIKNGENGYLVPPQNPEKLADAMLKILEDKSHLKLLGEQARKTVENGFSLKSQVEGFQALYDQLAPNGDR